VVNMTNRIPTSALVLISYLVSAFGFLWLTGAAQSAAVEHLSFLSLRALIQVYGIFLLGVILSGMAVFQIYKELQKESALKRMIAVVLGGLPFLLTSFGIIAFLIGKIFYSIS